jgi:hypothetical protein
MIWFLVSWVATVALAVACYFAYVKWMPGKFASTLSGWKTNVFGTIVAVAPDILTLLTGVQALGESWEPSQTVTWVMRGIGVTTVVLRMITSKEQRE